MSRWRVGVLVSLAMLALGGAPVWAAPAPALKVAVARYSFTGARDGNGSLLVTGWVKMGAGAMFSDVVVLDAGSGNAQTFAATVIDLGPSVGVRGYGRLAGHSLCRAPLTCSISGGLFTFSSSFSVSGNGSDRPDLRQYIAVRGPAVHIQDDVTYGWRARHQGSGLIVRTDQDASGAGADIAGLDVGLTTAVSASGYRTGSVAILVPACEQAGAGLLSLTGGPNPVTALCPSGPVTAVSQRGTHWSATGAAAGVSGNQTRLVVIEL